MNNVGLLLIYVLFFGIMGVLIYWAVRQGGSGSVGTRTTLQPREVMQAAIQTFTARGWVTTSHTGTTATFSRTQTPGCGIALVLFLFGIIPGLIYWAAGKRTLTVSVSARDVPGETKQSDVHIAWNRNGGARGPCLEFQQAIAPGMPIQVIQPPHTSTLVDQVENATGGALSAAQLRRMPQSPVDTGSGPAWAEQRALPPWEAAAEQSPRFDLAKPATAVRAPAAVGTAGKASAVVVPAVVAPAGSTSDRYCTKCGTGMEPDDAFCSKCGAKLR